MARDSTERDGGKGGTESSTPIERQRGIYDLVTRVGQVSAAEVADRFKISVMTAHRDFDELARQQLVRKFHGGITALPSKVFDSTYEFRTRSNPDLKAAIGASAVSLVEPGMAVLIEDSTTTLEVARRLAGIGPLTVITNFPAVVEILHDATDIRVVVLGGEYNRRHRAHLGLACLESLANVRADLHFSSTSSMTTTHAFHSDPDVVLVKRRMMEVSGRSVLLMDHTKVNRTALHMVSPLTSFDHVIIDDAVDDHDLAALRERHPSVLTDAATQR